MINYMDLNGARTLKNKILAEIDSTYQKKSDAVNIDTSNLVAKDSSTTVGNIAVFDSEGGIADSTFSISEIAVAASDTSITISDYKAKVNLDASSDNILTLTANGLLVDGSNISAGGAAKVEGATAGNIAVFDSDGGIADSGLQIATLEEVNAYLDTVFPL